MSTSSSLQHYISQYTHCLSFPTLRALSVSKTHVKSTDFVRTHHPYVPFSNACIQFSNLCLWFYSQSMSRCVVCQCFDLIVGCHLPCHSWINLYGKKRVLFIHFFFAYFLFFILSLGLKSRMTYDILLLFFPFHIFTYRVDFFFIHSHFFSFCDLFLLPVVQMKYDSPWRICVCNAINWVDGKLKTM